MVLRVQAHDLGRHQTHYRPNKYLFGAMDTGLNSIRAPQVKPPKEKGGGIGRGVIAVYRSQIRPAIGDRCVLLPSCSEYSHQAFQQHGFFIGAAMTADRFVREPKSVTAAARLSRLYATAAYTTAIRCTTTIGVRPTAGR